MKDAYSMSREQNTDFDIYVIGGGINGVAIARDAVGRGLRVGLAEMNDLASATSSASTKLFHGGLRYLEFFEIKLVREALKEREILLQSMPHISWPMRFVLPYHKEMRFEGETPASKVLNIFMPWMKGRRPAWMIRVGLFLYDHLGGRKILPATSTVDLVASPEGAPLKSKFKHAYEYSDCWVEDARLVALNARDAAQRGAEISVGTKVLSAEQVDGRWLIHLLDAQSGNTRQVSAKLIVNAGGPWVEDIIKGTLNVQTEEGVRLVRGSHIVTKKLFDHDKCYFFQGEDGRIIFAIPYEGDFTLIGTTDADHTNADDAPYCTDAEADYLCHFASQYFEKPVHTTDIVWRYSGVRPLYDDGAKSATAATREYVLKLNESAGAPVLNVFGGKITTHRKLAEHALDMIAGFFPKASETWTVGAVLPGGDFPVDGVESLIRELRASFPFLDHDWASRLVKAYGTDAGRMLQGAQSASDLGLKFGANLTQTEVTWLMKHEFARRAKDVVWRRSKLGLRMSVDEIKTLDEWMLRQASLT